MGEKMTELNYKQAVIEILANCAYRYVHPESVHKLDPQSVIDKQIDNGVETLKKFFAPAPAQEPRPANQIAPDYCEKHDRVHKCEDVIVAAQPVENSSRCRHCGFDERHEIHHSSGDGFWQLDHVFQPKENL